MSSQLVFGKYEIQQRLAVGGMGEVFFAKQVGLPGFERPAILKSLLPDLAEDRTFVDQFLDEARVAATLNHPNVVSIYEVGLWNGTYFIAMEYIRGRNLSQIIRRSIDHSLEIPIPAILRIIFEAALGLHHAHQAEDAQGQPLSIVHRDISPQNIMVREDGVAKVVDFGIARAANRVSRTATGTMKGKLAYMAPEQILGKELTAAADQWALGVCFWELLTRRRLFRGESDLITSRKVLEDPIPLPDRSELNPAVQALVMRTLERDASRRFASCGELAHALQAELNRENAPDAVSAFMRALGSDDLSIRLQPTPSGEHNFVISLSENRPAVAPEATNSIVIVPMPLDAGPQQPEAPKPEPRKRTGLLVGLAAVALLGVGIAGFFATRAPESPPLVTRVDAPTPEPTPPRVVEAPVAVVPAAPATLKLTSVPPKVSVRVDGKLVGTTPLEVAVAPDTVHYLQSEAPGFRRLEREVRAAVGEVMPVVLTLVPVAKPLVATPPAVETNAGPGFLTLETRPWTKVSIDGEPIGATPVFKRKLTPGVHRLQLVNEGQGINTTRSVTIISGQNQKLSLTLN